MDKAIVVILKAMLADNLPFKDEIKALLNQAELGPSLRDPKVIWDLTEHFDELAIQHVPRRAWRCAMACHIFGNLLVPWRLPEEYHESEFQRGVKNAAEALWLNDGGRVLALLTEGIEDQTMIQIIKDVVVDP